MLICKKHLVWKLQCVHGTLGGVIMHSVWQKSLPIKFTTKLQEKSPLMASDWQTDQPKDGQTETYWLCWKFTQ